MIRLPHPPILDLQTHKDLFSSALRTDLRSALHQRHIRLQFDDDVYGVVAVHLGKTRVHAKIDAQVVQPRVLPNEGWINVSVVCPKTGRGDEAIITRNLEKALKETRAVETEGLCVLSGKAVWAIKLLINVIVDDGSLIDACSIAALASLLSYRRPDTSIGEDDEIIIHTLTEKLPIPLTLHHLPIAFSFGVYGDSCLLDLDANEEKIRTSDVTVVMNAQKEICCLIKNGLPLPLDSVTKCVRIVETKVDTVLEKIITEAKDAVKMVTSRPR